MLAAEAVGMPATAATAVAAALDVIYGSAWVGHNIDLDNPIGRAIHGHVHPRHKEVLVVRAVDAWVGVGLGLGVGLGVGLGLGLGSGLASGLGFGGP